MTPENFVYWLQGVLEIGDVKTLDETQVQIIKDHIALVLTKVTPDRTDTPTDTITPSPWWGIQLPNHDEYVTCTDGTFIHSDNLAVGQTVMNINNTPLPCGTPVMTNYVIESTC